MCFFHEVTLLYASLGFHDQVLSGLARRVRHATRPGAQWDSWGVMVLRLAAKSDIAQWVLDNRLENVGWLHPNLLREAPMGGSSRRALSLRLHVELVDNDLEYVELLDLQVTQQLFIRLIGCVQFIATLSGPCLPAPLFINLVQEAIAAILQLDHLLSLKLPHVVLVAGFFGGVVALIDHV